MLLTCVTWSGINESTKFAKVLIADARQPYRTAQTEISAGSCSRRYMQSRRESAAPRECPTVVTVEVLYVLIAPCTADRICVAVLQVYSRWHS